MRAFMGSTFWEAAWKRKLGRMLNSLCTALLATTRDDGCQRHRYGPLWRASGLRLPQARRRAQVLERFVSSFAAQFFFPLPSLPMLKDSRDRGIASWPSLQASCPPQSILLSFVDICKLTPNSALISLPGACREVREGGWQVLERLLQGPQRKVLQG